MILFCFLGLLINQNPTPDFVIITAEATPIERMTLAQLRSLYLKRLDRLRGTRLTPLQLKEDNRHQQDFEGWLFGKHFDTTGHWIEERMRGGPHPPMRVSQRAEMLLYVARNPGFIGFLPRDQLHTVAGLKLKQITLDSPRAR